MGEAFLKKGPPPRPLSKTLREVYCYMSPANPFGMAKIKKKTAVQREDDILPYEDKTDWRAFFCLPPGGRGTTKWWKEPAGRIVEAVDFTVGEGLAPPEYPVN